MNVPEAEAALAEAEAHRTEAAALLARAETNLYVATTNRDSAERHHAAMVRWVEDRERVLREAVIANDGGYHPKGGM